ncbi:MAG: hypothetical protein U9R57_10510 [Thermodesulfobacteriota bacterium]|nr:hypothetical protein [Thermodesulfobacteriota bacterium]
MKRTLYDYSSTFEIEEHLLNDTLKESNMVDTREELKKLIAERAYKEGGHFRTPSGILTNYFDFFKISLKHQGIKLTGSLVYEEIKDLNICALGGPGHPISSVVCRAAFLKEIGVFYIRDSMRKEGNLSEPKWIESRIKAGDRVALVGDVVATGSQLIRALEEVIQFGAFIVKIIIVVDILDGNGVENIVKFTRLNQMDNCPVKALYTRNEILGANS